MSQHAIEDPVEDSVQEVLRLAWDDQAKRQRFGALYA